MPRQTFLIANFFLLFPASHSYRTLKCHTPTFALFTFFPVCPQKNYSPKKSNHTMVMRLERRHYGITSWRH